MCPGEASIGAQLERLLSTVMLLGLQEFEEFWSLPAEKVLLRWMNFHLKKAGHKKPVTNFSSDIKVLFLNFLCFPCRSSFRYMLVLLSVSYFGCGLQVLKIIWLFLFLLICNYIVKDFAGIVCLHFHLFWHWRGDDS